MRTIITRYLLRWDLIDFGYHASIFSSLRTHLGFGGRFSRLKIPENKVRCKKLSTGFDINCSDSNFRNSTPFMMYSKVKAPAAERNKDPILEVLKGIIKVPEDDSSSHSCRILEISSGNGLHITHFASNLSKKIFWQPSENDRSMFSSICAYMKEGKVQNVAPPIFIDIREPFQNWRPVNEMPDASDLKPILEFQENSFNYIYNANLMHISSFACTEGLFKNSGKLLKEHGSLITYGPYSQNGVITPESNVRFDTMLRTTDPSWGLRDIQQQLVPLAEQNGLKLRRIVDMPANNKILVWVKQ